MHRSKVVKVILSIIAITLMLAMATATPAQTASQDGRVRVWVEFQPGKAARVEAALKNAQAQFHYRFEDMNAFVVSLPEAALDGIRRNPNVVMIEEDAKRFMLAQEVPYGIDLVQARDVWDADRNGVVDAGAPTGAGRLVCIIDSGIYTQHEDLQGVNVVGGYPADYTTDKCGHGTHVAGTIAAANNALGVVGVTPGAASLYSIKVFGDDCSWTYASNLADAANRCVAAGADVISMSLGGPTKNKLEERAFNNAYSAGALSIAAAGNAGTSDIEYPGGYASVVAVAAIDANKQVADFSQFNSSVELAAPGVAVKSTVPYISTNTLTVDGVTYSGSQIEFAAFDSASGALVDGGLCATAGSWSGKVVLCQRGDFDFVTKVMSVQNGGGVAAVIYNNVPGGFLGTLGEGNTSSIPAISLSQEDGLYLVANKLGQIGTVTSTVPVPGSSYEAWDGTSMATPHVSGVAALIWSANPSWTNAQIREAMTSTALDLGAAGRDVYYGFGLVQAKAALDYLGGGGPPPPPPGALVVTVGTNKETYLNGETVLITVTVKDDRGSAVDGAAVALQIKTPKRTITLSGTTNTGGVATFTHKVSTTRYGKGTYTLTATATKDGFTTGTGTDTFVVE